MHHTLHCRESWSLLWRRGENLEAKNNIEDLKFKLATKHEPSESPDFLSTKHWCSQPWLLKGEFKTGISIVQHNVIQPYIDYAT